MELARIRLRGVYAIVAAALLLIVAPLYQGVALGSAYTAAVVPIATRRDFGPYLAWLAGALAQDRTLRVLQALPLLLALTLPGAVGATLWARGARMRTVAQIAGWAGFGLYVFAGVVGLVRSGQAASDYAAETSAAAQASIAQQFGQTYALQAILSRSVGGLLVALFIALASIRFARARPLPRWLAYLGAVVAGLIAANALLTLLNPLNVGSATGSLSLVALGVWLGVVGIALAQLSRLPETTAPESDGSHADAVGQ